MAEQQIKEKLEGALQDSQIVVRDTSGGCGSMYSIEVVSPAFKNMTLIKQHKMINEILKEEIKGWHGLTLKTSAPKD